MDEGSILSSTKKILGLEEDYDIFDIDIITHINSAFSILSQIGVGPVEAFTVEDKSEAWDDLELPKNQLNIVRSYIYMKTRMSFDPPATGFLLDAMKNVIQEQEVRLSYLADTTPPVIPSI